MQRILRAIGKLIWIQDTDWPMTVWAKRLFYVVFGMVLGLLLLTRRCDAEVFFSDNFDSGTFAQGSNYKDVILDPAHGHGGTGYAMRGEYNFIEDQPQFNVDPGRDEYYVRYYIFYAAGMRYWSCKIMRMGYWSATEAYSVNVGWSCLDGINDTGMMFNIRGTTSDTYADLFWKCTDDLNSWADQWLCFECHIRLNTPGEKDGQLEFWLNDKMMFTRRDLNIRGNIDKKPYYHWIFGNYSNGIEGTPIPGAPHYVWIDDVVYSTDYIGMLPVSTTPTESATRSPTVTASPSPTPTRNPTPTPTLTIMRTSTGTPMPTKMPVPTPKPKGWEVPTDEIEFVVIQYRRSDGSRYWWRFKP